MDKSTRKRRRRIFYTTKANIMGLVSIFLFTYGLRKMYLKRARVVEEKEGDTEKNLRVIGRLLWRHYLKKK